MQPQAISRVMIRFMECCLKQSIMWESTLSKKLRKDRSLGTMEWPLVLISTPPHPNLPTLSSYSSFPLPSRPMGSLSLSLSLVLIKLIGMQVPENSAIWGLCDFGKSSFIKVLERKLGPLMEWFAEKTGSEVLDPQRADELWTALPWRGRQRTLGGNAV